MKRKHVKGTAMIEFVIVFPVLILLMMGIMDYSVVLYDRAMMQNASIKAVRYGIVRGNPNYVTTAAVSTYAKKYLTTLVSFASPIPAATVVVTQSSSTPKTGDTLTVKINFTYTRLSYMSSLGFSSTVALMAQSTMTYE